MPLCTRSWGKRRETAAGLILRRGLCVSQAGLSGWGTRIRLGREEMGDLELKGLWADSARVSEGKLPESRPPAVKLRKDPCPLGLPGPRRTEPELPPGNHGTRRESGSCFLPPCLLPHPSGKRTLFGLPNLGRAEQPGKHTRPPRASRSWGARAPRLAHPARAQPRTRTKALKPLSVLLRSARFGHLRIPTKAGDPLHHPPRCTPHTAGWLTRFPLLLIPFRGSFLSIRPSSARSTLSPDLLTRIRRYSSSPPPGKSHFSELILLFYFAHFSFIIIIITIPRFHAFVAPPTTETG